MKQRSRRLIIGVLSALGVFALISRVNVLAAENIQYYIGEAVNTGKDNGYSGNNEIKRDDPHFGWSIGEFYIDGFTRVMNENTENPIFLKNVGDNVTLWFVLEQDITCLNGNKNLVINADENGYEEVYNIPKSDLGRGTLIVRHTDYTNKPGNPLIYRDYLAANVSLDADTTVRFCEEGDYEVSLLYEVKDNGFAFFDSYNNYRISFKFSVRNGNAMVFPFDTVTFQELSNSAFTENGFYLDLAKSRYLDVNIKKEVLQSGADGLVEDVRFNRPAKDGDRYTEEGIYTITVTNRYTNQTTEKKIYVGTNSILKAHVVTGLSISEIEGRIANGATVAQDGTIVAPVMKSEVQQTNKELIENITETKEVVNEVDDNGKTQKGNGAWIVVVVVCVALVSVGAVFIVRRTRKTGLRR